ncbi:MAG: transglutaminase-like domain-containing protein [Thermodesulfobacteriota bacterium]
MPHTPKRVLFNITGAVVVAFWMVLMGIWISRNLDDSPQRSEITGGKSGIDHLEREWMEIYLKDRKVGYAMNQVNPFENAYLIQEEVVLNLNLLGQSSVMRSLTRAVVDGDFYLQTFFFRVRSGVVTFQVSGKVDGNMMHVKTGEERTDRERFTVPLDGPVVIGAGMSHFFKGRTLEPGMSFQLPLFDPSTMSRKQVNVRVVEKESVVINRIQYPAYRLEMRMFGQDLAFWVDEQGILLKEKGFMGLTLVKSSGARAAKDITEGEGADFYELASVPVERKLSRPRSIRRLKVRLKGIRPSTLDMETVNQGRQRLTADVLEVMQEKGPLRATYGLPYTNGSGKMKPYLEPELTIQSEHPLMVEKAGEVSAGEKDPVQTARRLMQWVFSTVEKRPVVSVPSALEVLKRRVGDCNEHAVLLTALLRALKIPARLCTGLVYMDGRFYYHAWVEAYVGTWLSMDPTLNQMPADATHIKLAQGEMEKQVDLMALMGNLELEVMDYAYDSPH